MSAKDEADIRQLQQQFLMLSSNCLAAIEALSERIGALEGGSNNAVAEGDDVTVKASPNGQIKAKKAHR
jgi:hypothetical protein